MAISGKCRHGTNCPKIATSSALRPPPRNDKVRTAVKTCMACPVRVQAVGRCLCILPPQRKNALSLRKGRVAYADFFWNRLPMSSTGMMATATAWTRMLERVRIGILQIVVHEKNDLQSKSFYGAGDEARTRYLHLGKVALYRMSYTRISQMHDIL